MRPTVWLTSAFGAAREDWFAVTLDAPAVIGRVVFMHGRNFHDGGWFDASAGKPKVQVLRDKGGPWETIGELVAQLERSLDCQPRLSCTACAGQRNKRRVILREPAAQNIKLVRPSDQRIARKWYVR